MQVEPRSDLFLVRHGETDWNRAGRFQGRSDVPLNAAGIAQARAIGRRLPSLLNSGMSDADRLAIVSSPLMRARQTADEISRSIGRDGSDVEIRDELAEISYGAWEGLTTHEVKSIYPSQRRARKSDRWNFAAPGGESFASRLPAIRGFLAHIDRPTILVCHAGVIKICLYLLGAMEAESALLNPISQDRIYAWSKRRLAAH